MRIVVLDARTPLTSLRRELRYTLVRLRQRSWTKTWVTTFEALLKETETAEGELRKLQDALEDAEAELDEADLDLDRVVMYTAQLVRTELTGSLRTKLLTALFGSERPSDVIKPKLGEELARVKTWPAVLVAAPLAKIVAQKAAVEAVVKRCEDAEKALTVAQAAMAGCKVKTLGPLYDKANGERQALGPGGADRARDLDGEADAVVERAAVLVVAVVRAARSELVDQVTFAAHNFYAIITR